MDDHYHKKIYPIELKQHEDKETAFYLKLRDITVGASDDLNYATHLGMKY